MDAAFQCLPYPLTKLHKFGIGFDIFVARACERNIDNFVDARWSRRDEDDPVGQIKCLFNTVCNEQNGLPLGIPNAEQFVLQ